MTRSFSSQSTTVAVLRLIDLMPEQYQTILIRYIEAGGEADLERAYEFGRQAIEEGISVLDVIDAHYAALTDVLMNADSVEECVTITQRAASLLKEALGPFEMARRGYSDTIDVLRRQNEKLTKLMDERSRLLQDREDFMMVVTHDLKTPITAADRCLGLMLDGDFGELSPNQVEILSTIKDSNQRMFTMVRNLLEVYKYDQSTPVLSLKRVDTRALVTSIVKAFTLSAQVRRVNLHAEFGPEAKAICADEVGMQHVLTNLLDNALKFTSEGGSVIISVRNFEDRVAIDIKDTGKGIREEDVPRLFQRFFQSQPGQKQYTGTGLGLYLCKQIVNAHGGEITCTSTPGVGTTFTITLPASED